MAVALSGTVFIDRANRTSALKTFDNAVKQMKQKNVNDPPSTKQHLIVFQQSVWIFPEGTRSYADSPIMLPFKKGAFHFAIQAGVPIVPVVVANYERLFSIKRRRFESGKVKIQGTLTTSPEKVTRWQLVLDPITTTDLTSADVDRIALETREKMLTVLEKISSSTNDNPVNGTPALKKEL
jgi:lysophosphatidate acyltransferase